MINSLSNLRSKEVDELRKCSSAKRKLSSQSAQTELNKLKDPKSDERLPSHSLITPDNLISKKFESDNEDDDEQRECNLVRSHFADSRGPRGSNKLSRLKLAGWASNMNEWRKSSIGSAGLSEPDSASPMTSPDLPASRLPSSGLFSRHAFLGPTRVSGRNAYGQIGRLGDSAKVSRSFEVYPVSSRLPLSCQESERTMSIDDDDDDDRLSLDPQDSEIDAADSLMMGQEGEDREEGDEGREEEEEDDDDPDAIYCSGDELSPMAFPLMRHLRSASAEDSAFSGVSRFTSSIADSDASASLKSSTIKQLRRLASLLCGQLEFFLSR